MTLAAADSPTPGNTSTCSPAQDDTILNRSQQSFKYDHLRKEASDYKPWSADSEVVKFQESSSFRYTELLAKNRAHLLFEGGRFESSNRSRSDCICLEPLQTRCFCHILQTNRGEFKMSFYPVIVSTTYCRMANPLCVVSKITSSSQRITGTGAGAASGLLPYLEGRQRSLVS